MSHSLTTPATQLAIKIFTRICTKFKLLFLIADIDTYGVQSTHPSSMNDMGAQGTIN